MIKAAPFLSVLLITGFLFPVFSCNSEKEPEPETWEEARPLCEIYQNEFLVGNVISPGDLSSTVRFGILKRHYNTVTAENHMKPDQLAPSLAPASASVTWNYRFTAADSMVTAARNAGLKMHGHTLIWHQQSPVWLAAGGEAYLNKFVTDVAAHFKGKLISWDVVNEAMREGLTPADTANWKNCLRKDDLPGQSGSPWNRVIGPDYIEKAFLAARAADPEVKLFYNDYNLNNANKAQAVYNMVRDINTRYPNEGGRKLIDGIGMQTHHHVYTDPNTVDASITLFASLGVDITVSEMDIQASGTFGTNAITWGDSAAGLQAKQYAAMFRIFKKHASKISRVTFWGLDDRTSWRANTYPTLLDKDYGLKPAFLAVSDPGQY